MLADLDIAQAHLAQRIHLLADRRDRLKEVARIFAGHVKNVGYAFVLELDFQRFAVVALALAGFAGHVNIGQKVHLDLQHTVALAGLAPPALDVKAKAAGLIAARLGLGQSGEPVADRAEGAGIGGGV